MTCLARSVVMMPAPASSAALSTSSVAPFDPCPTRNVTFEPALMMSAAVWMSAGGGVMLVDGATALDLDTLALLQ